MSKRKRILVVGLPLFAKRVTHGLQKFGDDKYIHLDTYYSKIDRLKALFLLPFIDVVYSLNGSTKRSGLIKWALRLNKKVVLHWAGSDVLLAQEVEKHDETNKSFVTKSVHFCQSIWIQKELKELGINAKIVSIHAQEKIEELKPMPQEFRVLMYLPEKRAEFYGEKTLVRAAQRFPDIKFNLIGTSKDYKLPNVTTHGWVSDVNRYINDSVAIIRFAKHDSLADIVLQSIHRGRYVLYNYDYPYCIYSQSEDALINNLEDLKSKFEKGEIELNYKGHEHVSHEFDSRRIFLELSKEISAV